MIIAAIVAGGTGSRMGAGLPKQFIRIGGRPVIARTADAFLAHTSVDAVVIGVNPDFYDYALSMPELHDPQGRVHITRGGSNRNETIENIIAFSLSELGCSDSDIILSHDAVRPFVSLRMIDDSIRALETCEICTAAVPETDTVAVADASMNACAFPDRSTLYRIQTPQSFRTGTFRQVYSSLPANEKALATDVCSLYKRCGYDVRLIRGELTNIKLTYPEDLRFAQAIIDSFIDMSAEPSL